MSRRQLLLMMACAVIAPGTLRGQQKPMPVIGFLSSGASGAFAPAVAAFRQGLSEAGYVEGQNVVIEYRWAAGRYDRLPALAADLVTRKVDVIASAALLQHWRQKTLPRRSRSFSASATRSSWG